MTRHATLSLDLDNHWAYLRARGTPGWDRLPSYLALVVPRILELLDAKRLRITFFIVGQDAAAETNDRWLRAIADAGHEIANHSFGHEADLHTGSSERIDEEIARAEACIERATGERPVGFRGPSFGLSAATLEVLARRGYLYDATTFPTVLGPLARAYYSMRAGLDAAGRRRRRGTLGGGLSEGFRPLRPYYWRTRPAPLLEIPVTTMPLARTPVHATYLQWLGGISPGLARAYHAAALGLCARTGTPPSMLLHPTDFLGDGEVEGLSHLPAMNLPAARKLALLGRVLDDLAGRFEVMTLGDLAQRLAGRADLRTVAPRFQTA